MSDPKLVSQDAQTEHIGTAPHPMRNLLLLAGGVGLLGVMGLFYWQANSAEGASKVELDQFRQAMFTACKDEQFSGATRPEIASLYADSSRMRSVVQEQFGRIKSGKVDCDHITRSLRSVDFPLR